MFTLSREQLAVVGPRFFPERPGPLVAAHVVATGQGRAWADRWPDPHALIVDVAGNVALAGDATRVSADDLRSHAQGFVEAPEAFAPVLRDVDPHLQLWRREMFEQAPGLAPSGTTDPRVRRLMLEDGARLADLSTESSWISKTWGGPQQLADSGYGWCVCVGDVVASIACTFFLGRVYEDIAVVTEPAFRGRGLSVACARALCADIWRRGHRPSWTTSPDNIASLRAAARLGFTSARLDRLYLVGIDPP